MKTKKQIDEVVKFAHNGNPAIIETLDFRDGVRYALEFIKRNTKATTTKIEDVRKVNLTAEERYVLSDIAGRVLDAMAWDSADGEYTDAGNFVFSCSKADLAALKRATKKL